MTNIQIMKKAHELQNRLKEYQNIEEQYKDIQKKCQHDVMVLMYGNYYGEKIDAECPFCRKTYERAKDLRSTIEDGSQVIDIRGYVDFRKNPEIVIDEIQEMLLERIKPNEENDFEKIASDIEKTFKER